MPALLSNSRQKFCFHLLAMVLPFAFFTSERCAGDVVLHVSPLGRDTWSGQSERPLADNSDGPLASMTGARDALRKLRIAGAIHSPVKIQIAPGTYSLTQPVLLEPIDSGTSETPVTYEAADLDHPPVFSGGKVISGFTARPDGLWSAQIPQVQAGQWTFEQFWVDGQRMTRSRLPRKFYFHTQGPAPTPAGQPGTLNHRAFRARPRDLAELAQLSNGDLHNVLAIIFHSWDTSRARVESIDAEKGIVTLATPIHRAFGDLGPTQRFYFDNVKAAPAEPGEWFLDPDGTLLYRPLPGQSPGKVTAIAPLARELVRIAGNPRLGQYIQYVTLRGLDFEYAQWLTPPAGQGDYQAVVSLAGAINLDGAQHVNFDSCQVAHVPGCAVWFRKGCSDCILANCYLHELGAGAIRIATGQPPAPAELTSRITIDNNILRDGGNLFPDACAILITHSPDNQITHNQIDGFRYTGVSVGWVWGYGESISKGNRIEYNHIHHIGMDVMNDLGGIYTLGPSTGTVLSNNVIHDVYSYMNQGWGLYNDEGTSDVVMENNLIYRTKAGGYHQHYGHDNIIRNNIFVDGLLFQLQRTRAENHLGCTFEHNIIYTTTGSLFWGKWLDNQVQLTRNDYWKVQPDTGEPASLQFSGLSFTDWQKSGKDAGSIVADPRFVDPSHLDFHLRPDSPALSLGFKPFDYSKAGVYGDPSWVRLANDVKYPPREIPPAAPAPPPLVFADDFESYRPGAQPARANVQVEEVGSIRVVDTDSASPGHKCLCITDAPGQRFSYDPHFYYEPHHRSGITRFVLSIKFAPGVKMFQEWRDDAEPYHTGPRLVIDGGHLRAGQQPLMDLPPDVWSRVEISCPMGAATTGVYDLTVTVPGQAPHEFKNLPLMSRQFKQLDWLGFSAMNTDAAVWYLDDLVLSNSAPEE